MFEGRDHGSFMQSSRNVYLDGNRQMRKKVSAFKSLLIAEQTPTYRFCYRRDPIMDLEHNFGQKVKYTPAREKISIDWLKFEYGLNTPLFGQTIFRRLGDHLLLFREIQTQVCKFTG